MPNTSATAGQFPITDQLPLIVYFSQLDKQINYTDPDDLSEILGGITGDEAGIFIQTPGGSVDTTENFIAILNNSLKSRRVIVPSWAKSAGTIIAISSSDIVLGAKSEF